MRRLKYTSSSLLLENDSVCTCLLTFDSEPCYTSHSLNAQSNLGLFYPIIMAAGSIDSKKGVPSEMYVEDISDKRDSPAQDGASNRVILDPEQRAADERRLVRKLDMRLMPMIILIFIMNYIDVCVTFYSRIVIVPLHMADQLFVWTMKADGCNDCETTRPRTGSRTIW